MSKSWQESSKHTSGFNNFKQNQEEYSNMADTVDFLAFSDNSPQASPNGKKFTPNYYSSPRSNFYRKSPRNYPQDRKFKRWSSNNRSYSHCSSNNSSSLSKNSSWMSTDGDIMDKFLHPSFLEDPWAKLIEKLQERQQQDTENITQT